MSGKALVSMPGRPLIVMATMLALWGSMRFVLWPQETLRVIEDLMPAAFAAGEPGDSDYVSVATARGATSPAGKLAPAANVTQPALNFEAAIQPRHKRAHIERGMHGLLWLEAVTRGDFSYPAPSIATNVGAARNIDRTRAGGAQPDRWSLDAWLFARDGAVSFSAAPRTYGASQAGMLLRYRLAPGSRFAPAAYARVTASPDGAIPAELAVGAAVRPLATLPIEAQLEMRLRERDGRIEARPAVALVGGLDRTVAGIEARGYGQAGYVAGADATAFADGKLTLEKVVATGGGFRLAAGGGTWGGAQRDAARVDVGPSASLTLATERVTARIEADYRIRVAGDAAPGSGPALTVSASF